MLCAKALENGIETGYVQNLVKVHRLVPEEPPQHIENWPWPVKIHTLGRFSLLLDDRPVRFPGKAQHKPLEMLKALIALGGRDVGVERLAEALWPDASGDAAQSALDTTLHRLRKLLDHEKAIQLREGRVSLDSHYCWVDVWALERLMGQAESSRSPELTEKALALYRGPFLGQETEQSWAIPLRERLRSRVLRHLVRECRIWEDARSEQSRGMLPEGARDGQPCRGGVSASHAVLPAHGPPRRGARSVRTVQKEPPPCLNQAVSGDRAIYKSLLQSQ
jgi:hypothetical protein